MKIICITPIKHIEGIYDKLKSYGKIIYKPHITKEQLKTLLKNSDAEYLLVGANKQNFILGEDVLKLSNEEIHRKLYGDSWDGSVNEGGWKKLFDILEHNHNHLPIHANNQKVKISKVIQKFMDKS